MTLSLVSTSSELRGVHASMPEHKAKYAILHQVLIKRKHKTTLRLHFSWSSTPFFLAGLIPQAHCLFRRTSESGAGDIPLKSPNLTQALGCLQVR